MRNVKYFISNQEACQLTLQNGTIGKDGEITLLELKKSIKIHANGKRFNTLIRARALSWYSHSFTGLRPSENLYEELSFFNEHKVRTAHKKVMIFKDSQLPAP